MSRGVLGFMLVLLGDRFPLAARTRALMPIAIMQLLPIAIHEFL
jgi:hypothetical protein